jgi:hypothetical protein
MHLDNIDVLQDGDGAGSDLSWGWGCSCKGVGQWHVLGGKIRDEMCMPVVMRNNL